MQRIDHDGSQRHLTREDAYAPSAALPIACNLDDAGLATRLESLHRDLFAGVEERQEMDDGYAFRFPGTEDWAEKISEFVASERRCCTFFRFELTFEPNLGPIWLKLSGSDGVKEFIEMMFTSETTG